MPEEFVLKIKFTPTTGQISLEGPIDDEALCDYMMKKAAQTIEKRLDQLVQLRATQQLQAVPPGMGDRFLNGLKR